MPDELQPKFTPGPWEIVTANKNRRVSVKAGLASVGTISVTNVNCDANAHLIADAPRLYAALQGARDILFTIQETSNYSFAGKISEIDQLLADARGEPHV